VTLSALGCPGPDPVAPNAPNVLEVTPRGEASLQVGQSLPLKAAAFRINRPVSATVTWTSRNPQIATVSSTGVVTAVGPGDAVIVAQAGRVQKTKAFKVTLPPAALVVTPTQISVEIGQAIQMVAQNAKTSVSWSSDAPSIAVVSQVGGIVTGARPGNARITASTGQETATADVTVKVPAGNSLSISFVAVTVPVGGTRQLAATLRDASGNPVSSPTIAWQSSSAAVATVSATGAVTGVSPGSTSITASSGGRSATATVTVVRAPVAFVAITPAAVNVDSTKTVQLTATLRDSAGNTLTGRAVSWTTSNPAVASVSSTGLVTGVSTGSATVTATSEGRVGGVSVAVNQGQLAATTIAKTTGDDQSCSLGTFNCRFEVKVTDAQGRAVPGAEVQWSMPTCKESNGNVFVVSALTDQNGLSRVANVCTYPVGVREVVTTQVATLVATNTKVTFNFKQVAPPPSSPPTNIIGGTNNVTTCGLGTFDCRFTVRVTNAQGVAVNSAEISWTVPGCNSASGDPYVFTAFTNAQGESTVTNVCTVPAGGSPVTATQIATLVATGASVSFSFTQR
jgi:uncharacterized protein YjdB